MKNTNRYCKTNGLKKEVDMTNRYTYNFVICNQKHKVLEAYNKMKNNHNSDIEYNSLK